MPLRRPPSNRGLTDLDGQLVRNHLGATLLVDDEDMQIMELYVEGVPTERIAKAVYLSVDGVKSRKHRLYKFLGVHDPCSFGATLIRRRIVP